MRMHARCLFLKVVPSIRSASALKGLLLCSAGSLRPASKDWESVHAAGAPVPVAGADPAGRKPDLRAEAHRAGQHLHEQHLLAGRQQPGARLAALPQLDQPGLELLRGPRRLRLRQPGQPPGQPAGLLPRRRSTLPQPQVRPASSLPPKRCRTSVQQSSCQGNMGVLSKEVHAQQSTISGGSNRTCMLSHMAQRLSLALPVRSVLIGCERVGGCCCW